MGTFHSTTTIKCDHSALKPIADAVAYDFQNDNYKVQKDSTVTGGYVVTVTKGNIFMAVLGMQTALKVMVKPVSSGVSVDAGVGIFGQQSIPTIITLFFAWPILLTQVWGLIRQAKMDNRAIGIACEEAGKYPLKMIYCPYCGTQVVSSETVCPHCHRNICFS